MTTVLQPSFTGGELGPSLWGRVDLAQYQKSLGLCSNFIVQAYGGIKNRQGTRFISAAKSAQAFIRLIPFVYSADQSYVLEIGAVPGGAQYMRVYTRGRQVVYGDNVPAGSSIGDPVELTGLPWLPADLADLKYTQSADVLTITHPAYPPTQILRYAHDWWGAKTFDYKNGPFEATNPDTSLFVYTSAPTGVVTVKASTAIFKPEHSGRLFRIEQRSYGKPWETNVAVVEGEVRRSDGKYYRALAPGGTTGTLRPTHSADTWSDGKVDWAYLHSGFGIVKLGTISADTDEVSASVLLRIPDPVSNGIPRSIVTANISAVAAESMGKVLATVDSVASFPTATFSAVVTFRFTNASGGQCVISEVFDCDIADATHLVVDMLWTRFTDLAYASLDSGTVHYRTTADDYDTYRWAFGAWGGDAKWPSCSTYFQQRQIFAGSPGYPQSVWFSRTDSYSDFGTSEPILDDDALSYNLASSQIDRIRSLISLDKLVMFTQGGNWVTGSGQDDVITPANISAKLQNYYGASNLSPLGVGNAVLYYGKSGTIRDMGYDYASDSYTGNDLSVTVPHLMENRVVVDWAFQPSPFPIIWCAMDDGALLGMTYLREQAVTGWHRHDVSGDVKALASINECNQDHLYMVVSRTVNGSTYQSIEYMSNRVDDLYEQFFVDAGVTFDFRNVTYRDASGTTIAGGPVTVTGGTTWTSAETLTITYTPSASQPTLFVTGAPSTDIGDHIVLEGSDGLLYRILIAGVSSTTVATGTLVGTGTLHSSLRATATTSWAFARDSFSGFTHLEGKTVDVYSDGAALAQRTVSGGAVSLSGEPGFVVHIGLPITSEAETLAITVPGQTGPALEQKKLTTNVRLMLEKSRTCMVGEDSSHLYDIAIGSNFYEQSSGVQTGILEAHVAASWNRAGKFYIKHTTPTALSILSIMPDVVMPPKEDKQ